MSVDGKALPTADDFIEVTTRNRSKCHFAERESKSTLCGHWAYNQGDVNASNWRKPVTIAALPPCRQCDKSRARRMEGRPQ